MATTIRFQLRGDSAENWASKNPVLLKNEPAYDQTNNRLKLGDGVHAWNELDYVAPDVVNDLITGGELKALSAEQGIRLKALIDTKADTTKIDELTELVKNSGKYIEVVFEQTASLFCNINDSKEPTGTVKNLIIPDNVDKIYISGCGAGGGLGIQRGTHTYLKGWNGGYCRRAEVSVNSGDVLNIRIGVGGEGECISSLSADFKTPTYSGSCSRGQDTVIKLNGEEIIRLGGGRSGLSGHAGNQTGDTIISSKVNNKVGMDCSDPYIDKVSSSLYLYDDDKKIYSLPGGNHPYVRALPASTVPFYPYGSGGSIGFSNTRSHRVTPAFSSTPLVPDCHHGTNGLVIVELGMSHINVRDISSSIVRID